MLRTFVGTLMRVYSIVISLKNNTRLKAKDSTSRLNYMAKSQTRHKPLFAKKQSSNNNINKISRNLTKMSLSANMRASLLTYKWLMSNSLQTMIYTTMKNALKRSYISMR